MFMIDLKNLMEQNVNDNDNRKLYNKPVIDFKP